MFRSMFFFSQISHSFPSFLTGRISGKIWKKYVLLCKPIAFAAAATDSEILMFNLLYVAFPQLGLLLKQLAHPIVLSPCLLGVYQSMMAYTSFFIVKQVLRTAQLITPPPLESGSCVSS